MTSIMDKNDHIVYITTEDFVRPEATCALQKNHELKDINKHIGKHIYLRGIIAYIKKKPLQCYLKKCIELNSLKKRIERITYHDDNVSWALNEKYVII